MKKKRELNKKKVWKLLRSTKCCFTILEQFESELEEMTLFEGFLEEETYVIITDSEEVLFFKYNEEILPSLRLFREEKVKFEIPEIIVDSGAIKPLLSGADLFRPGIISFSDFNKGDLVIIKNEQNSALCLGETIIDSSALPPKGKTAKNIHFIGDFIFQKPK